MNNISSLSYDQLIVAIDGLGRNGQITDQQQVADSLYEEKRKRQRLFKEFCLRVDSFLKQQNKTA